MNPSRFRFFRILLVALVYAAPLGSFAAKAKPVPPVDCFEVLAGAGKIEVEMSRDMHGNPVGFYVFDVVSGELSKDKFKLISSLPH